MTLVHETTSGPWRQDVGGALAAATGGYGLSDGAFEKALARLAPPLESLRAHYENDTLALLRIPEAEDDISEAEEALAQLSEGARTIVFFGTGGSSLGGQMLAGFAGWNIPGDALTGQSGRPRTRFYDNLDARTLARALQRLDLESTRFVVISKSGNTPETLAQTIAAMEALRGAGLGARLARQMLAISDPPATGKPNGLRALLEPEGVRILDHHPGIGGRYSVLTNVGLLPALARGVDVKAVRAGARVVVEDLLNAKTPEALAPAVGAALQIGLAEERGIRVSVMMPYADRLARFAHWYAQLWGESLGKGGRGTTPVAALGPLDQHSQLQLYMDGPRDHLITFVRLGNDGEAAAAQPLDAALAARAGVPYLGGQTVGALVAAEAEGVARALRDAGRPVRTFEATTLDEAAMGALVMHFMLETILAAHLLGVDPFDQPAVEAGKRLARQILES